MAQSRQPPRRHRIRARTVLAVLLGALAGALGGGYAGWLARHPGPGRAQGLPRLPGPPPLLSLDRLAHPMTILVMGVDATGEGGRDGLRGNTDTMLLLRPSPADGKLYVYSIPRDTRVPIAGHGVFKINAACEWGGPKLAMQTVSRLLDLPIDHYLLLSLDGLIQAIDAIGGVEVTVPKRLDYDDWSGHLHIHLKAGRQHLDGRQVEELVRFRHDRNGTDIARVERQQMFLMQVARQFFVPQVALRIPELWGIASRHADTDLSPQQILRVAHWVKTIDPARDIEMSVLPGDYHTIDRYCFWVARPEASARFLDAHFGATLPLPVGPRPEPRIAIWNETGHPLDLHGLARALRLKGYNVWYVERRKEILARSQVVLERGDVAGGHRLAQAAGISRVFPAAVGDVDMDFTLELGQDWISRGRSS